jgi:hypothetical protein
MGREVMNRLIIDLDDTIWHAKQAYDQASRKLLGIAFEDHFYTPAELRERFGDGYVKIFEEALHPERVPDRRPFPGFITAARNLHKAGYTLHFLSHNHRPEAMYGPIGYWLTVLLKVPFLLGIAPMSESKVEKALALGDVVAIIDDRPETLLETYEAGLQGITKLHAWTEPLVEQGYALGFDRWREVPEIISGLTNQKLAV